MRVFHKLSNIPLSIWLQEPALKKTFKLASFNNKLVNYSFSNSNYSTTTMSGKSVKNVFITGANSGLGLEMVKQLLKNGSENIFATYRNPARSEELIELAKQDPRVKAINIDMRRDCKFCDIFKQVYEVVKDDGINLLVNNAGIFTEKQGLCELDKATFMEFLEVNTVSPILLVKDMLPLLEKAAKKNPDAPMGLDRAVVVNITSSYGSISANNDGGYYYSRCCRSALNSASKNLSVELKPHNILVAAVSPGWVRTEQGGPNAPLSTEESVAGMIKVFQGLDDSKNGIFVDYAGTEIPW